MPGESEGQTSDELRLYERIEGGDRAAFDAFVDQLEAPLFRYLRALCRSEADAEDALQEAFISVWRSARTGTGLKNRTPSGLRSWVWTIARNASRRGARLRAGEPRTFEDLEELGGAAGWDGTHSPEALASALESRETLRAALRRLDAAERDVVWLRDIEGLSGPETAAVLGVSLDATKSRLHRARLRLRAELQSEVSHEE